MFNPKEKWLNIKDYEKLYEISNLGRIRNKKTGRILKYGTNNGYFSVTLSKKNKQKSFNVHRLLSLAFIKKIKGKNQVNHKNGIKTDNRLENLEWVTHKENIKHASKLGLLPNQKGFLNHSAKLSKEQIKSLLKMNSLPGILKVDICKKFNVCRTTVYLTIKKYKIYEF